MLRDKEAVKMNTNIVVNYKHNQTKDIKDKNTKKCGIWELVTVPLRPIYANNLCLVPHSESSLGSL